MNFQQDNQEDSSEGFNHTQDSHTKGSLQKGLEDYPRNYSDAFGVSVHPQIRLYLEDNSSYVFRGYSGWKSPLQAGLVEPSWPILPVVRPFFQLFIILRNHSNLNFFHAIYVWFRGWLIFFCCFSPINPTQERSRGNILSCLWLRGGGPHPTHFEKPTRTSYLTEKFAFQGSIFSNHTRKPPKSNQHYNKTMENYSACLTFYQLNLLVKPYMMVQKRLKPRKKNPVCKTCQKGKNQSVLHIYHGKNKWWQQALC